MTSVWESLKDSGQSYVTGSNNTKVSDLINYGSYSGADIKVIVHLPYNTRDREKKLAEIREEINEIQAGYLAAMGYYEKKELERKLSYLKTEYEKISSAERGYGSTTETLGNLQTLSYSVFRGKTPVRRLGGVYPKTFVRGSRTIGGTMIFTLFNTHVLYEILEKGLNYYNTGQMDKDIYIDSTGLIDQLPPLDISILFANEYGSISHMGLWGVEFMQEGGTFSVEDIFSEATVNYVARDIDPMRTVAQRELDNQGVLPDFRLQTASQLYKENAHLSRRYPFI